MATQVTPKTQDDIEWYLNALEREARWAVDLVQRWKDADEFEQEDLIAEWPLTIDFLMRSLSYQDKGLMTQDQLRHLQEIRLFLSKHEPVLADVLGRDNLMLDPPSEWYASL
jgi:hypothetical protein